jgi:hypothetical protein
MTDWFSAFARDRDPDAAKNRVTRATWATPSQKPNKSAAYAAVHRYNQLGNVGVTRATSGDFRNTVTQVTQAFPNDELSPQRLEVSEFCHSCDQVTSVTPVTHEIRSDSLIACDWRDFYQERAAIMEYDGESTRKEAEHQALEWCIATWLAANPSCGFRKGFCPVCGEPISSIGEGSIFNVEKEPFALVHRSCADEWPNKRRILAITALEKMGIFCIFMEATK